MQKPGETWLTEFNSKNSKVVQIKQRFNKLLLEQSSGQKANYYDFLVVAKKIGFRFYQSSHLMSLKRHFARNGNSININKLVGCLAIHAQSINLGHKDNKIIVKFLVAESQMYQFKTIHQNTEEEQKYAEGDQEQPNQDVHLSSKMEVTQLDKKDNTFKINDRYTGDQLSNLNDEQQQEINNKTAVIMSIKIEQMNNKIKVLTDTQSKNNIYSIFQNTRTQHMEIEQFKHKLSQIIHQSKGKIKISEDDAKTIFYILTPSDKNYVTEEDLSALKDTAGFQQKMKRFYLTRINRKMVKNTLFKLGKNKNSSIQIYQVKNASLLDLTQIQDSIVGNQSRMPKIKQCKQKYKKPHFGPIKGARDKRQHNKSPSLYHSMSMGPKSGMLSFQLSNQRQKIEKIIRGQRQKQVLKRQKSSDTVSNKLRSLFIHKVILPRQKLLQNETFKKRKVKTEVSDLSIFPLK